MRRFVITILALALLPSGCGGADDTTGTTATIAADTTTTIATDTVATDTTAASTTALSQGNDSTLAVDVCSLLSSDEIDEVLGAGGEPTASDVPPQIYGCRWENSSGLIDLSVFSFPDAETAEASFGTYSATGDVDGVGDKAVYNDITDLAVLSGSFVLTFDVATLADEETSRSQAKELALLVIPRLP